MFDARGGKAALELGGKEIAGPNNDGDIHFDHLTNLTNGICSKKRGQVGSIVIMEWWLIWRSEFN